MRYSRGNLEHSAILDVISKWQGHIKFLIKQDCEQGFWYQSPSEWDTVHQLSYYCWVTAAWHRPRSCVVLVEYFLKRESFSCLGQQLGEGPSVIQCETQTRRKVTATCPSATRDEYKNKPTGRSLFCVGLIFNLYFFLWVALHKLSGNWLNKYMTSFDTVL